MNLFMDREILTMANRRRRRRPFTDPIHRQHRGVFEWRGIERRGRVAQMMLGKNETLLPIVIGFKRLELVGEQRL